ncbi:hypothetical protein RchiOBHm_Chr1g0329181 [Rosa chinensis]|uniref:Uncharacterized protein n=1 Tax=Rosa chinensis TaxID=74649 RepID=A0A2P6SAZ5_ROSCH|nr:hypothetical protein RchiOBHm_Chr1g0329181 [Rosa chinensis]
MRDSRLCELVLLAYLAGVVCLGNGGTVSAFLVLRSRGKSALTKTSAIIEENSNEDHEERTSRIPEDEVLLL